MYGAEISGDIVRRGVVAAHVLGQLRSFPFSLLTMVVSLSDHLVRVRAAQPNRQVAGDRVRNDIEYQVNLKAELEIGHLHEKRDSSIRR